MNSTAVRSVLFDAAATEDPAGTHWLLPLHAWVYKPQAAKARRALIAELFEQRYGLTMTEQNRPFFERRMKLLLADNQPGIVLTATIHADGKPEPLARVSLPPTRPNGHASTILRLPMAKIPHDTTSLTARLASASASASTMPARIGLLSRQGLSVICDIDDTVKISGVTERRSLWEKTFFAAFATVDGMPDLLKRLAGPTGAVHYVSSSPWHLYEPLREWMLDAGLPIASLDLKQIRLKDRSILNILKSPTETKPPAIRSLLERFPSRRFVLVGDSGEKDPEIYAEVAAQNAGRITGILVRLAPGGDNRPERFASLATTLPAGLLQTFTSPTEVNVERVLQSN